MVTTTSGEVRDGNLGCEGLVVRVVEIVGCWNSTRWQCENSSGIFVRSSFVCGSFVPLDNCEALGLPSHVSTVDVWVTIILWRYFCGVNGEVDVFVIWEGRRIRILRGCSSTKYN